MALVTGSLFDLPSGLVGPQRPAAKALETWEQIAERRDEHQALWESVPCPLCEAGIGFRCRLGFEQEILAGLAHARRIQSVVGHWGADNSLPKEIPAQSAAALRAVRRRAHAEVGNLWA